MASGPVGSGGGGLNDYRWIKADIHQCLNTAKHNPDLGQWNPGAIDFMKAILANPKWGIKLSCGGFREDGEHSTEFRNKVDRALLRQGIDRKHARILYVPDDRYILAINDRAIDYQDDWPEIEKRALQIIKTAESGETPDIPNDMYGRRT